MLYNANDLRGFKLEALDGDIGKCEDFLFDDQHWTIRYMDARAGNWFTGTRVLISPVSLGEPDWDGQRFPVNLSREQIKNSPAITEDQPISRQYEASYYQHYGYGYYWLGNDVWGAGASPYLLQETAIAQDDEPVQPDGDTNLRSVKAVTDYSVTVNDERIGKVDGFLVEDGTWAIRYLVADTGKWLSHHRVVLPPALIKEISWAEHAVAVSVSKEALEQAPAYDDKGPLTREYEQQYYQHFGKPPYWK